MAKNQRTALLIVNPNSRRGGETDFGEGIELLQRAGIRVTLVESTSVTQTEREIATRHRDIDLVIVAGGDGTISSTAPALYKYGVTLAILPLGTANDFARSVEIPQDLSAAFQAIADDNRKRIDLGVVNGHYFFNASHIGLGVNITHELNPEIKKNWGVFGYLKALFTAITQRHTFSVALTINDKDYNLRSIQVTIGNGRFYGGGNVVDQDSSIDDGLLRLYSIRPKSLWELLYVAPLLRFGKRQKQHMFSSCGSRIEVKTRHPMEVDADGELVTHTPAVFEVIPGALEVISSTADVLEASIIQDLLAS